MNLQGVIIATDGNLATVEINNNPGCVSCSKRYVQGACGSCAHYDSAQTTRVIAINDAAAAVGDRVCIARSKRQKLFLFMMSFVIPIVCAVLAYFCLSLFTDADRVKSGAAIAAAVIAMIIAGLYSYKIQQIKCDYKIISVIKD